MIFTCSYFHRRGSNLGEVAKRYNEAISTLTRIKKDINSHSRFLKVQQIIP